MGGAIISESGGGIIPLRGAASSRNWGAASSGISTADIQDRDGGGLLMATLFGLHPFLLKLYADGGYQGARFQKALRTVLERVNLEIVKRSDQTQRFVVLPKRWIVERTFAWLGRCRRLAKDWECFNRKALAFLKLASIRLMLRKLCNPT
jgi:transposase